MTENNKHKMCEYEWYEKHVLNILGGILGFTLVGGFLIAIFIDVSFYGGNSHAMTFWVFLLFIEIVIFALINDGFANSCTNKVHRKRKSGGGDCY